MAPARLRDVRILDNVWIQVDADTRLSTKLWLPQLHDGDAADQRFSVILEYLPYRKSDWTASRDARNHTWMAQRGFAVARVDIRGSGDSNGYDTGEYTPHELNDCVVVIDWLAQQSWCTGSVGMFGKSWGGFNGLQLAGMAPPALKGIVSLYSIDDRYADDVHYMGGTVMGSEALSWATVMLEWNARPPSPETVGTEEEWKAFWKDRLEHHHPWLHDWLGHQTRGPFWQQGSISEDYSSVQCPVLVIGGWADGYHNGVFRMVNNLQNSALCKGIIGPWSHEWPNIATPGPQIGFLEVCRLWWEHSLNGVKNEVESYPDLQVYVKHAIETPSPQILEYPGEWIGVQRIEDVHGNYETFYCDAENVLSRDPAVVTDAELIVKPSSLQGAWSGEWLSFGGQDMPGDQTPDDALALSWSSPPLSEAVEIVGFPEVSLYLKSSHSQALVMARLCDVSPATGKSTLISRGVLNLSHRHGHAPEALELMPVGEATRVTWQLNGCAYKIPAGHRLLLAITPSYWPMVWPSPEPTTLSVAFGQANTIKLPILGENRPQAVQLCPIKKHPVELGSSTRTITLREAVPMERKLSIVLSETDVTQPYQQTLVVTEDEGKSLLIDQGILMDEQGEKTYAIDLSGLHPSAKIHRTLTYEKLHTKELAALLKHHKKEVDVANKSMESTVELVNEAEHTAIPWKITVTTNSTMTSDAKSFYLHDKLVVHLNDHWFYENEWDKEIPRDFV